MFYLFLSTPGLAAISPVERHCIEAISIIADLYTGTDSNLIQTAGELAKSEPDPEYLWAFANFYPAEFLGMTLSETEVPQFILRMADNFKSGNFEIDPATPVARMGTEAGRQIIDSRYTQRFPSDENVIQELVFLSLQREKISDSPNPESFNANRKQMERLWNSLLAEDGFNFGPGTSNFDKITQWAIPPEESTVTKLFPEYARRVFKATGRDLVREGLLNYVAKINFGSAYAGVEHQQSYASTKVRGKTEYDFRNAFYGMPIDIFYALLFRHWNSSPSSVTSHPFKLSLVQYRRADRDIVGTPTQRILEFKDSADVTPVIPLIDAQREKLDKFVQQTPSENTVWIPVPSSRGIESNLGLCQYLQETFQFGRVEDALNRSAGNPQHRRTNLWERAYNAGRNELFSLRSTNLIGADVVLVDDVVAYGTTGVLLSQLLLKAGARSVRLFTLARVEAHSEFIPMPELPPLSDFTTPAKLSSKDYISYLNAYCAEHHALPYRRLPATSVTSNEKSLKSWLDKKLKDNDLLVMNSLSEETLSLVFADRKVDDDSINDWVFWFNSYIAPSERPEGAFTRRLINRMQRLHKEGVPRGAYPKLVSPQAIRFLNENPLPEQD